MAQHDYDIAIVGAGIVGSTLASLLAAASPNTRIVLVDRDVRGLHGSTGHAPGFVGQLNTLAPLTELARRSMKYYCTIPGGFEIVGGLELAMDKGDLLNLAHRAALAQEHGIPAAIISADEAAQLAPAFVSTTCAPVRALHFVNDGTANARRLAHAAQDAAAAAGAKLIDVNIEQITRAADGGFALLGSSPTGAQAITAKHVAVCTGVWAGQLLPALNAAAVSVAHPYAYTGVRAERTHKSPFVRWPTAHVYARDHGARDGIGSYAHDPVHVQREALAALDSAYGQWEPEFGAVLDKAFELLPEQTAARFLPHHVPAPAQVEAVSATDVPYAFNGLFTVTPDGMPLVGTLDEGLYCGVGVWVTHAGGSAAVLADIILEDMGVQKREEPTKDADLRQAIDPKRFGGKADAQLEEAALASYNDIYNKNKA